MMTSHKNIILPIVVLSSAYYVYNQFMDDEIYTSSIGNVLNGTLIVVTITGALHTLEMTLNFIKK